MRQLHSHKMLLLFWVFLLAVVSGGIGEMFGASYLFLEPEYLGEENFWSTFLVGSALGAFLFAYAITFYINESYRFHFIGFCKHPFFLMAYNNFLIPGSFLLLYFYRFISYHHSLSFHDGWHVFELVGGLVLGILLIFAISATYFFAETNLFSRFGERLERSIEKSKAEKGRWVILGKARESLRGGQRADYYVEFPFRIRKVKGPDKARLAGLINTLNEHHGKLLLLQVLTFALIAILGLMEDKAFFQIPAGASFLLMLSLLMMVLGAATFWFRRTGLIAVVIGLSMVYFYGDLDLMRDQHYAAGLSYDHATPYTEAQIRSLQDQQTYLEDREHTLAYLNNWKQQYQEKYGRHTKPKAVFVSASGGGLRSAFWTFRTMQYLDSISDGRLSDEVRLYTGASGGMFGLSYFRELYWQRSLGLDLNIQDEYYSNNMSKDMLNRIFFRMFSDLFMPTRQVSIDGQLMSKEAGYSFDRQLEQNLPELRGRRIGDYAEAEKAGLIAPLILAPTIINQGRKLFISSQPVSFLTYPGEITGSYYSRPDGIEFRRFFDSHQPDSLHLATALRMNATFPVVLPVVSLPSQPQMQVMDAGVLDNYGTQTAIRYLFEFRDWFEKNTAGIVMIQIRDSDREEPIEQPENYGLLNNLFTPIGGGYKSMMEASDLANDHLLEYVKEWYFGPIDVVSFEFPLKQLNQPTSLSWHLTKREKRTIERTFADIRARDNLLVLERIYQSGFLAQSQP